MNRNWGGNQRDGRVGVDSSRAPAREERHRGSSEQPGVQDLAYGVNDGADVAPLS